VSNPAGRFEAQKREAFDDGWEIEEELKPFETIVTTEASRSVVTRNESPDLFFDRSINPYRGCEHGCIYCFARPTHSYLGWSSGLDFETRLIAKTNAAEVLERELSAPGYEPRTIVLGTATDPYQPIERQWRITRQILEVLERAMHPVIIVTKSALVMRDADILARMAANNLAKVSLSLTSLDHRLSRSMEPRAASPARRINAIRHLTDAGVPVTALIAPIIPALNDHEIEALLEAAFDAGARHAGWALLRLPHDLKEVFREWLMTNEPGRYHHVMNLLRSMREGKDYDAGFGRRFRGQGPFSQLIAQRFDAATRRIGYARLAKKLDTTAFRRPTKGGEQLSLF
jgi:DNA repair photolyase